MRIKIYSRIALLLVLLQLCVVLGSWILSATFPDSNINSLISSEGIRWYSSNFVNIIASPILVWIILLAMAYGCYKNSGLPKIFDKSSRLSYRERTAMFIMFSVILIYIIAVLLLIAMPRAILLSAVGNLWPSPFSEALVPMVSLGICLSTIIYAVVAGHINSITHIFTSLTEGISMSSSMILLYILIVQLYYLVCFVVL